MSLRPDLRKPMRSAWLALAGTTVVLALVVLFLADRGDLPKTLAKAERDHLQRGGGQTLSERISQSKAINDRLATTIEGLKRDTGFTVHSPFLVPVDDRQPGQYFKGQLFKVMDSVREVAARRSIAFDERDRLGFGVKKEVPDDREAQDLLTMLQLVDKCARVVLGTPTPIEKFDIDLPTDRKPVLTGPSERPPLLREYPFTLKVSASLPNLLAVLHALATVNGEDDFPLIVRSLSISSRNLRETSSVYILDAVIDLAGMQFLSVDERATLGGGR